MASLELPDDHVMPVGLPNMYTHIKIRSRQSEENVEGPGKSCRRDYFHKICFN